MNETTNEEVDIGPGLMVYPTHRAWWKRLLHTLSRGRWFRQYRWIVIPKGDPRLRDFYWISQDGPHAKDWDEPTEVPKAGEA